VKPPVACLACRLRQARRDTAICEQRAGAASEIPYVQAGRQGKAIRKNELTRPQPLINWIPTSYSTLNAIADCPSKSQNVPFHSRSRYRIPACMCRAKGVKKGCARVLRWRVRTYAYVCMCVCLRGMSLHPTLLYSPYSYLSAFEGVFVFVILCPGAMTATLSSAVQVNQCKTNGARTEKRCAFSGF
jgi:hypothetical protein